MMRAIRLLTDIDRDCIRQFVIAHWGDERVVAHGEVIRPHEHAGFAAFDGDDVLGLITYRIVAHECEVITLDSLREGQGIGTALMNAAIDAAKAYACNRIWLITTNDNGHALAFYQRRGFVIAAVHRDAVTQARQIKPSIPLVAENNIPIRDEIEMEMWLNRAQSVHIHSLR